MKICFACPSLGTQIGGTESVVYQFARHLARRHEVLVLTGGPGHRLRPEIVQAPFDVVTARYLPRSSYLSRSVAKLLALMGCRWGTFGLESLTFVASVRCSRRCRALLNSQDVVSLHSWQDSLLFSRYLDSRGVPTVFHAPGVQGGRFFRQDRSRMYVANSRATRSEIESRYAVRLDGVVTLGVDAGLLSGPLPELSGSEELLYVGRLDKDKGLKTLFEILAGVKLQRPQVRLTLVGEGPLRPLLEKRADELGLGSLISFAGSVGPEEVGGYFRRSRALIHPTRQESFGLTVLEAMACGLPVVATDLPALRELTQGRATLLPDGEVSLWVESVIALLQRPDGRRDQVIAAREVARKHTWADKALEYEAVLVAAASHG